MPSFFGARSDRIRSSLLARQHVVEIDLRDLIVYNEDLAQSIQEKPGDFVPMVRVLGPLSPLDGPPSSGC